MKMIFFSRIFQAEYFKGRLSVYVKRMKFEWITMKVNASVLSKKIHFINQKFIFDLSKYKLREEHGDRG